MSAKSRTPNTGFQRTAALASQRAPAAEAESFGDGCDLSMEKAACLKSH
jgi:hypothetical protein